MYHKTMQMIKRKRDFQNLIDLMSSFPVVAILGPRQCGKTTLARLMAYDHFFDLENPRDISRLDQPLLALEGLKGTIVIDEIQRRPDLFPTLRYLVDHHPDQKYLILGSASRDLLKQSSESLAGRIAYYHLSGFQPDDMGNNHFADLWLRGGLPRSFLGKTNHESFVWRENYIATFLERDIPQLGITIPANTLRRFWIMLSHYHGQILNYAELGKSFGISDMTARKYCDILDGAFMIRTLQPWYMNTKKRLVKRPKIYLRDSGLFHSLLTIETIEQLYSHPKLGASWEGFALETISRVLGKEDRSLYFWATHAAAELDLFWQQGGRNWGVEFKYLDAPRLTKSMNIARTDLDLAMLWVVYPGNQTYKLDEKITVIPLADIEKIVALATS
jgi:predicted AAA+ superfamily ATPase